MSPSVHWHLLRPGRIFFYTFFWIWLAFLPLLGMRTATGLQVTAFLGWGLLLPWAIGMTLSAMIHEPLHRPFSLLLPAARWRFIRSHAKFVGGFALVCGLFGFLADPSLPFPALVGLAAVALSFGLPFEPGLRWAGSRFVAALAVAAILACIWRSQIVREFFIAHPWLCATGCFLIAALQFAVTFSRARLRARGASPFTTLMSVFEGPDFAALRNRENLARGTASRASWRSSAPRDSLRRWIGAVRYERSSGWRSRPEWVALACVVFVIAHRILNDIGGSGFQSVYDIVMPAGKIGKTPDMTFLIMLIWSQQYRGPRADRVYPVSRARRAQIAYAASSWQSLSAFGIVAGGLILAGWGAALKLGQPFTLSDAAHFASRFTMMIPFLPLMQWCMLYAEVRAERAVQMLCVLLALAPMFTWQYFAGPWTGFLETPAGALGFIFLIAVTQWAYYAALHRFYRSGDLIQTGTTRRNFSLV